MVSSLLRAVSAPLLPGEEAVALLDVTWTNMANLEISKQIQ